MNYKGLVDPKNKPFGNVLPFEVQVLIMFWTHCFMTNDERKKMNAEFTRLPRCLETEIPKFVAFLFSTGYKSFPSALERKPYPRFYGCPHCFRRNTQQVSIDMIVAIGDDDKLYDANLAHILDLFRQAHSEIRLFELPIDMVVTENKNEKTFNDARIALILDLLRAYYGPSIPLYRYPVNGRQGNPVILDLL
ncbi:unnamed protein product, partial [Porites evermanni]